MRTTFFAAAMLALLGQAAYLESVDFDLADYDTELAEIEDDMDLAQIMDYDFDGEDLAEVEDDSDDDAQIDSDSEGEVESDVESEVESEVDSEGEENEASNVVIKLDKQECPEEEKKVPFEQAMLGALGELSTKSNELAKALQIQFAKNKKLAESKTMLVDGKIDIMPAGQAPDPQPKKKSQAATVTISGKK